MRKLHEVAVWLRRMLAAIGLVTVLVIATPVVSWWARAYASPIDPSRSSNMPRAAG